MALIRDALSSITAATDRLKRSEKEGLLTVSAMTSFAATWLLPRLSQFSRLHPEINIRVDVRDDLTDFLRDGVDVALRYGTGGYPDLASEWFLAEEVFPVCSPKLVEEGPHPLRTPEDLKHHTLIHDFTERLWDRWLELAGVSGVDTDHGPSFNLLNLAIDAAIAGGGVALGRSAIVQGALDDGRLVKPFDLMMSLANSYFFVCPQEIAERPKIVAFRYWIVEQADS
jgi:LysR family glycine cleavage system transcriptional activator